MVITIKVESTIIVLILPLKQQKTNRILIFANLYFNRVIFINFVKTYLNFDLSKMIMSLGYKFKIVYYNNVFITVMVLLQ